MAEIIKYCTICGAEFTAHIGNAKFCSDSCRKEGTKQRRKAWEEKTGFKDKHRKQMQEKRKEKAAAVREEMDLRKVFENKELMEQREAQRQERLADLKKRAKKGDSLARMSLALYENGLYSVEYWQAYADYEIEIAESFGVKSSCFVNDISVYDEEFALKVLVTMETQAHFRRESHRGKK